MAKFKIRKDLPIKRRQHQRCHSPRFLAPKNAKKDIASPKIVTTLNPTLHLPTPKSLARARKRAQRVKEGSALTFEALPTNKAMRAALYVAKGGRPDGVRKELWKQQAIQGERQSICELKSKDLSWDAVYRKRYKGHPSLAACSLCLASSPPDCYCGAQLYLSIDQNSFCGFASLYRHPQNPVYTNLCPGDQRRLAQTIVDLAGEDCKSNPVRAVLRICLYLSIVGVETSMDTVSRALLDGCREDLKIALRQTETGVFRGGQRPLAGGVANIPAVVAKWEDAYFDELAQVLSTLSHKTSRSSRNPLVWKVVEIVATSNIDFFKDYRRKRFLDLLALAGLVGAAGINIREEEYDCAAAIYPVAANTGDGVKEIFAGATSKALQRCGIQCLRRVLSYKASKIGFSMVAAMLCFARKEASGAQKWISNGGTF